MSEADSNQIIDWLERLSRDEGYVEARQLRRDIIDAMGEGGVSWDGLEGATIEQGVSTWLGRPREGGVRLPAMPAPELKKCGIEISAALGTHANDQNRPATLSVEQYGDAIQAIWTALRGPDDAPDPTPSDADAVKMNAKFKLGR